MQVPMCRVQWLLSTVRIPKWLYLYCLCVRSQTHPAVAGTATLGTENNHEKRVEHACDVQNLSCNTCIKCPQGAIHLRSLIRNGLGGLWKCSEVIVSLHKSSEVHRSLWKSSKVCGSLRKSVEVLGNLWKSSEIFGSLQHSSNFWPPTSRWTQFTQFLRGAI